MTPEPRITARGLGKSFALHKRGVKKASISTDGLAAFADLIRHVAAASRSEASAKHATMFHALQDVDFDVYPGEVLGIIGRNGAGKSTLLKILARVLDPTHGRVSIKGRVVSLLELGIGFAPDLTVRENIQIYGRLAGFPAREVHAAEDRILAFAELERYRDTLLDECPSGSFVQLAFAAMISLSAEVVLADEVLTVGDSEFRQKCEDRIRAVGRSGESVLFVSHDMNAIRRCSTRVMWIDKGRVRMTGPTDEVVSAYTSELLAGRLQPLGADQAQAACRLIDVRLLDRDRAQTGALQITKPSFVEVVFRIERPDVWVFVETELWQGKQRVFASRPDRPVSAQEPAAMRASLALPADFLNEASYQVRGRLLVRPVGSLEGEPLFTLEERVDFTAFNPHPEQSVWSDWPWGRSGLISPRLPWSVAKS